MIKETEQIVANLTELFQESPRIEGWWYRWDKIDYTNLTNYILYKKDYYTTLDRSMNVCKLFIL